MTWTHQPESAKYSESWNLLVDGNVEALVVQHTPKLYSAYIYPLGKPCKIGDVYGSASGAKAACVHRLRKKGII